VKIWVQLWSAEDWLAAWWSFFRQSLFSYGTGLCFNLMDKSVLRCIHIYGHFVWLYHPRTCTNNFVCLLVQVFPPSSFFYISDYWSTFCPIGAFLVFLMLSLVVKDGILILSTLIKTNSTF
jgi:hypothetical protein